ncbi:GNAT family N-acetyltransferase [Nocardioides sp.]|uniref:GNAT family N-acetyltransferase n=1 Tax=Nocardioides sp. TaxID=35761 RepID=UPI0035138248
MPVDLIRAQAASAAWTYTPEGAREVSTPEYRLVGHPSWSGGGVELQWLGPLRRTVRQVVDEVREIALGMGVEHLTWCVRPGHPDEFEREVLLRGGTLVDEAQVLAASVDDALPRLDAPHDVVVTTVEDLADLRAATDVAAAAFGTAPLDDDDLREQLRADTEMPEAAWFLARLLPEGRPVGAAGATLDAGVVRLWGGSVHPEVRGRGVYRALLAARLHRARLEDADLALAKGHLAPSAPILRRCGFVDVGVEREYLLPLR